MTRALPSVCLALLLGASAAFAADKAPAQGQQVVRALHSAILARAGRIPERVLVSKTKQQWIKVGTREGALSQRTELLFDGKRVRIRIITDSDLLLLGAAPKVSTVSVPTGRLLRWWGATQLNLHFPELTPSQVRALADR